MSSERGPQKRPNSRRKIPTSASTCTSSSPWTAGEQVERGRISSSPKSSSTTSSARSGGMRFSRTPLRRHPLARCRPRRARAGQSRGRDCRAGCLASACRAQHVHVLGERFSRDSQLIANPSCSAIRSGRRPGGFGDRRERTRRRLGQRERCIDSLLGSGKSAAASAAVTISAGRTHGSRCSNRRRRNGSRPGRNRPARRTA